MMKAMPLPLSTSAGCERVQILNDRGQCEVAWGVDEEIERTCHRCIDEGGIVGWSWLTAAELASVNMLGDPVQIHEDGFAHS